MNKLPCHVLRFIGSASVILAGLGLWYNGSSFFGEWEPDPNEPYFWHAFYTMSAIYIACYLILLFVGIQLIRLKLSWVRVLVAVMVFEVACFFSIVMFLMDTRFGLGVAAATVVATGGWMCQLITLFPLWGPLLALWSKRQIEHGPPPADEIFFPDEQVQRPSDGVWAVISFMVVFVLASFAVGLAWGMLWPGNTPPGYAFLGLPALLGVANGIASVRRRRRRRREEIERRRAARLRAGRCPRCEYNLAGLPEPRCPECGADFDPRAVRT